MFGRTVYQAANDMLRHKEQREKLTQQFHRSLKSLQQKEHVDGAIIVSNEASNSLCSVLDAVFLHGIKDNMMSKLVSYAQGVSNEVKLNFWSVVKKFTHKNVIEQLKGLSQINSDIGLCRAWIRLAINDGLMASYLASMMADGKAMKAFYHDWAYLLDYEQPDILRNHLTGLMGLRFQLSLNSSILNTWSTTTISLAGLAVGDTQSLAPVVRAASPTPSPPTSRHQRRQGQQQQRQSSQSSVASAESASAAADNDIAVPSVTTDTVTVTDAVTVTARAAAGAVTIASVTTASGLQVATVTSTPPNTPADPSFFNQIHDTDILKRFSRGLQSSSSSLSSSASSGQPSCPDPGESFLTAGGPPLSNHTSRSSSPHLGGRREERRGAGSPSPSPSPYDSLRYISREDRKRDEEMKLKGILQHLDQKELAREQQEQQEKEMQEKQEERKREEEQLLLKENSERQQRLKLAKEKEEEEKKKKRRREEERRRKKKEEEKEREEEKKNREEKKEEEKREEKAALQQREAEKVEGEGRVGMMKKEEEEEGKGKGEGEVREEEEGVEEDVDGRPSHTQTSSIHLETDRRCQELEESVDACQVYGEGEEEEEWKERESLYGNSLNAMDGWTTTSPYTPYIPHQQQQQQQATFDQSYESMLKGYHAQQGGDGGLGSVQKVLENLPGVQDTSGAARSPPALSQDRPC